MNKKYFLSLLALLKAVFITLPKIIITEMGLTPAHHINEQTDIIVMTTKAEKMRDS